MRIQMVGECEATGVDEDPVFHVYLWSRPPIPPGVDPDLMAWSLGVHEIMGADVAEVLDWARANTAEGDVFGLYAVYNDGNSELRLIRLEGTDPTYSDVVLRFGECERSSCGAGNPVQSSPKSW